MSIRQGWGNRTRVGKGKYMKFQETQQTPVCVICGSKKVFYRAEWRGYCEVHKKEAQDDIKLHHLNRCVYNETYRDLQDYKYEILRSRGATPTPKRRQGIKF